MEENKAIQEEAAVAAEVMNNVEGAAVPATSEEPEAVKAASLLAVALDTKKGARQEQCKLFGRHFSSTEKVEVVKKGAQAFLQSVAQWQQNLEALLKEIEQQESAERLQAVVDDAENLTPEEIQAMIAALQAKVAKAS